MPHTRTVAYPPIPRAVWVGVNFSAFFLLPVTNTFDVAPTIAMILGIDLPDAEGR